MESGLKPAFEVCNNQKSMYVTFSGLHLTVIRHFLPILLIQPNRVTSFNHVIILVKLPIWHGYHTPKINLEESMLPKISVRICASFWYQMALSRVMAHGLLGAVVVQVVGIWSKQVSTSATGYNTTDVPIYSPLGKPVALLWKLHSPVCNCKNRIYPKILLEASLRLLFVLGPQDMAFPFFDGVDRLAEVIQEVIMLLLALHWRRKFVYFLLNRLNNSFQFLAAVTLYVMIMQAMIIEIFNSWIAERKLPTMICGSTFFFTTAVLIMMSKSLNARSRMSYFQVGLWFVQFMLYYSSTWLKYL